MNNAKENILKRIAESKKSNSVIEKFPVSGNIEIYKPILPDAVTCFKNELKSIKGECEIFSNEEERLQYLKNLLKERGIKTLFCREKALLQNTEYQDIKISNSQADFESMEAAVISCEYLIARTGSVIVTSNSLSGRQLISYPPIQIIFADATQLIDYPEEAYSKIKNKYEGNFPSQITTITGPSRTADIEKTLVLGAHGPKECIVLLIDKK